MKAIAYLLFTLALAGATAFAGHRMGRKDMDRQLDEMARKISEEHQQRNGGSIVSLRKEVEAQKTRASQLANELQAKSFELQHQAKQATVELSQMKSENQVLKAELEAFKKPVSMPVTSTPAGMQRVN